jgi:hypothetical protein
MEKDRKNSVKMKKKRHKDVDSRDINQKVSNKESIDAKKRQKLMINLLRKMINKYRKRMINRSDRKELNLKPEENPKDVENRIKSIDKISNRTKRSKDSQESKSLLHTIRNICMVTGEDQRKRFSLLLRQSYQRCPRRS